MPCLVQREALLDKERGPSLKEGAFGKNRYSVWSIKHGVLILMRPQRQTFQMFQNDICFPKPLFLSLTGLQETHIILWQS